MLGKQGHGVKQLVFLVCGCEKTIRFDSNVPTPHTPCGHPHAHTHGDTPTRTHAHARTRWVRYQHTPAVKAWKKCQQLYGSKQQ